MIDVFRCGCVLGINKGEQEILEVCNKHTVSNIMIHTSPNLDDSLLEYMNQKLNYYKALQIAASLSDGIEILEVRTKND